jgi:putative MATE family efflux protein
MIGIGAASAISRSLGVKDIEKADYVAGNSFLLIVILSSTIAAIGLIFTEPMLRLFGATDTILPYAKDYITIILWGSIFFSFAMSSNNLIRAEGNAKVAMATMLIGAILNIILDPIFIFVFKMGVKGAALATVISKFVSFLYVLIYLYSGKSSLKVKLHHLKPKMHIIIEILTVGSAAFARHVTGSVVAIVVNNSLRIFGGDIAIIIVGILQRVTMFIFMPLFGVVQGMQPIVGFNYGAKKLDRVKETLKLSLITTTAFASFGWLIIELFPFAIISVFTRDAEIIEKGSTIMRIVISMIPLIGIQIVGAALFQSLGKAVPSLILALLREVLLFIPLVIILPRILGLGLWGIWIAYPAADILSVVLTVLFLRSELRKIDLWQTSEIKKVLTNSI